jgi:transcription initiation factor TFIIH subunit 1
MSVDSNLQAKAIYDKQPGVVVLSRNRLAWTPDGQSKPTVLIPLSKISSKSSPKSAKNKELTSIVDLHCSKEGAPKSKFKVGLTDNDAGHTFSLASPAAVAQTELVNFKRELLEVITRNNANATQAAQQPPSLALPGSSSRKTPRAETPSVSTSKGDNRAASIPGSPRPGLSPSVSSTSLSKSSLPDFEIRKRVLTKMPELASLHKELVISGQITESEFWEGREVRAR